MSKRNDPCPCGSGKKFKKCCMKDHSKGGSPTEKRVMKLPSPSPEPDVSRRVMPGMLNFAAFAMIQQRRMEERMRGE